MKNKFYTLIIALTLTLSVNANGEFFLKIEKQGFYSVVIGEQTQISPTGFYRFFDLPAGNQTLTITDIMSGQKLHTSTIQILSNRRKVYTYGTNNLLSLITELPVNYAAWYMEKSPNNTQTTTTNQVTNTQQNTNTNTNNNNNTTLNTNNAVNANEFQNILEHINKQSFDDRKLQTAKTITRDRSFTTAQIIEICKQFSFEKNKLDYAKFAYDYTIDKNNYYKVSSVFSFSSNARELEKYINSRR
jgi:hypothetical protein